MWLSIKDKFHAHIGSVNFAPQFKESPFNLEGISELCFGKARPSAHAGELRFYMFALDSIDLLRTIIFFRFQSS